MDLLGIQPSSIFFSSVEQSNMSTLSYYTGLHAESPIFEIQAFRDGWVSV